MYEMSAALANHFSYFKKVEGILFIVVVVRRCWPMLVIVVRTVDCNGTCFELSGRMNVCMWFV